MEVDLDTLNHTLHIKQKTVFYNYSNQSLDSIYLHNWPNSFKNRNTPLNQRLLEEFKKAFHFAKAAYRGFSEISTLKINNAKVPFTISDNQPDIVKIKLPNSLPLKDSIEINTTYKVKIPLAKYTKYGRSKSGYHLRFWYLIPAIHQNGKWETMSNLNLDDLFQDKSDYDITFNIPHNYSLHCNIKPSNNNKLQFQEKSQKDIIVNISKSSKFKRYNNTKIPIITDISKSKIKDSITINIFNKEISFLKKHLGAYPNQNLLIDKVTVTKNVLQELDGLPDFLKAYPKHFKYEMKLFRALSKKYIDGVFNTKKRNDYWLTEGLQIFLTIEYLKKFYPDLPVLGKYAKIWGLRKYNLSKIKHDEKFSLFHQQFVRSLLDQPLAMRADSLSNANKKIINKLKAGIGLQYLKNYVGDTVTNETIKQLIETNKSKIIGVNDLYNIIKNKTNKDLDWFFSDFIKTTHKSDYKIFKLDKSKKDSITISIKNLRKLKIPYNIKGVDKTNATYHSWNNGLAKDSVKTISLAKKEFNQIAINHNNNYLDFNSLNNYAKTNKSLTKKPLQLRFMKDFENPYYTQIFFEPRLSYNLYNGVVFGMNLNNKHFINHNFEYSITPSYAFGSKTASGKFSVNYDDFKEESKNIYKLRYGISGSSFNYDEDLRYTSTSPFFSIYFRQKNLRRPKHKLLVSKLIHINREIAPGDIKDESDKYTIANTKFIYFKPSILKEITGVISAEYTKNFTKLIGSYRHVQFYSLRRSFDVRFYGGVFLNNNTNGDYFDFNLNRGSDYLFEQDLIGRSEDTGFFSQQYVLADGGLKSSFENNQSNQFIFTTNTSVGLWNWFEVYNDFGITKNRKEKTNFFYENGIRFNFIPNFFEFYFPIYTNNGFEFNSNNNYTSKIRFIINADIGRIYNFFRRDFL